MDTVFNAALLLVLRNAEGDHRIGCVYGAEDLPMMGTCRITGQKGRDFSTGR